MKGNGLIAAARGSPVKDGEISWAQAYERRMRRFNLDVILFAFFALTLLINWLIIAWWAFSI